MTSTRRFWLRFTELGALWGVAAAQPIIFILSRNTDYFLRYAIGGWRAVGFGLGFSLMPPLAVATVESALVRFRFRAASDIIHHAALLLLGAMAGVQFVKYGFKIEGAAMYAISAAAVLAAATLWWRHDVVRQWLRWLIVIPVVVAAVFVFFSPVGRFARAGDGRLVSGVENTTPVVMIMFDEFPLASLLDGSGHIDAVSYPNFARLAAMSTWYRMYSTTTEETQFAVPTSLTGISSKPGLGATYADHPESMFTLLGKSHRMHVIEWLTRLCPPAACGNNRLPVRWSPFFDGIVQLMKQRVDGTLASEFDNMADNPNVDPARGKQFEAPGAAATPALSEMFRNVLTEWTAQIESSDTPMLHYVHVLLPHHPWLLAPSGDLYAADETPSPTVETPWETKVVHQRHLIQVQYLDTLVGEFLDRLEQQGILDDALVIVAADHGVSFKTGYLRRYAVKDYANALEVMSVPLFIKSPGAGAGSVGTIDDSNVDNEDLLSLIAQRLGVTVPWKMDGSLPSAATDTGSKTLRFIVPPLNGEARPDAGYTVSMEDYRKWVLTIGAPGVADDPLSRLYDDTPLGDLRGRPVADLADRLTPVSVRLGGELSGRIGLVSVDGTVVGNSAGAEWIALAHGGTVVGLAPLAPDGAFVTVVLDGRGGPVEGLDYYLVGGPRR